MNIYDYLKTDHQKVAKLFSQFEKSDDREYKLDLMNWIAKELEIHAESERKAFYQVLEQFEASKEVACHGEEEHEKIKTLIDELIHAKEKNANWDKKVIALKELVEHHVKDEEGKIFNKAKEVLSEDEAYMIKERMHDYKEKLLRKEE